MSASHHPTLGHLNLPLKILSGTTTVFLIIMQMVDFLSIVALGRWLLAMILSYVAKKTVVVLHWMLWLPEHVVVAVFHVFAQYTLPLSLLQSTEVQVDRGDAPLGLRADLFAPEEEVHTVVRWDGGDRIDLHFHARAELVLNPGFAFIKGVENYFGRPGLFDDDNNAALVTILP